MAKIIRIIIFNCLFLSAPCHSQQFSDIGLENNIRRVTKDFIDFVNETTNDPQYNVYILKPFQFFNDKDYSYILNYINYKEDTIDIHNARYLMINSQIILINDTINISTMHLFKAEGRPLTDSVVRLIRDKLYQSEARLPHSTYMEYIIIKNGNLTTKRQIGFSYENFHDHPENPIKADSIKKILEK